LRKNCRQAVSSRQGSEDLGDACGLCGLPEQGREKLLTVPKRFSKEARGASKTIVDRDIRSGHERKKPLKE